MAKPQEKPKCLSVGKIKKLCIASFLVAIIFCIWNLFPQKRDSILIPIEILQTGMPCIQIEIENKKLLFELDSGSDSWLSIKKEWLEKTKNKKKTGRKVSRGQQSFCSF